MIDTDEYEDAKKTVEDAGLIDDNDGWLDVHYRKIAHLLAEVRQLSKRIAEVGAILDRHRICDECGKHWDDHKSGGDCGMEDEEE